MNDDLISRKALLEKLKGKNTYSLNTVTQEENIKAYVYAEMICLIEQEPTAYDVDKVVDKLRKNGETMATKKLINGKHLYMRAISRKK